MAFPKNEIRLANDFCFHKIRFEEEKEGGVGGLGMVGERDLYCESWGKINSLPICQAEPLDFGSLCMLI